MKKHVGIITNDSILLTKIKLLLREVANVSVADHGDSADMYDALLVDRRSIEMEKPGAVILGEGGALPLSFRHEQLLHLISSGKGESDGITLFPATHEVYLSGESTKLTDVEYKLLDVILSADGFISKQEILRTVWGDGYDEGVVNVYVHYLRKKLEKDGTKVIISSRNEGYKIDEKYRRKGSC